MMIDFDWNQFNFLAKPECIDLILKIFEKNNRNNYIPAFFSMRNIFVDIIGECQFEDERRMD